MAKVVLTTKVNPAYDDLPEERYHFPRTYLNQIRQAINDCVVYYEPRRQDSGASGRLGRMAYFAVARITGVESDPLRPDHFYARIADYIDFSSPVPFREGGEYYERALQRGDGGTNRGAFGRAVRIIPDDDFERICRRGLALSPPDLSRPAPELSEEPSTYERPVVESLVQRPLRDATFMRNVRDAYGATCALTGIKIINGGGRAEVEAAHIRPVGDDHHGTDSIRNGIALCRTVHWMFDRGLIGLDDDYRILLARNDVPEAARRLLVPDGRALVPANPSHRPHRQFLAYHRANIFKG